MSLKFRPAANRAEVIILTIGLQGFPDLLRAKSHFAHRINQFLFAVGHNGYCPILLWRTAKSDTPKTPITFQITRPAMKVANVMTFSPRLMSV